MLSEAALVEAMARAIEAALAKTNGSATDQDMARAALAAIREAVGMTKGEWDKAANTLEAFHGYAMPGGSTASPFPALLRALAGEGAPSAPSPSARPGS